MPIWAQNTDNMPIEGDSATSKIRKGKKVNFFLQKDRKV